MALITGAIYGDPTGERYVKALWFESISSGTSGTLTPPTQGEIVLDQWSAGIDALASQISSGIPTFESPLTAGGVIITATLDALGAWTISGAPSAYPVAIVYCYQVKLRYFDYTKQLGGYELIPTAEGVYTDVTAFDGILAPTDSTVQKALEKLDNGAEPALTKGNLTGTSPITLSATRQVIGGAAAISLVNDAAGTITEVDTGALADSDTVIPTSKGAKDYADLKLAKASNLSDVAAQQTALNNITAVSAATNEHVLTKDTATGNAVFKVAASGAGDVTAAANMTDNALLRGDGGAKGIQDSQGSISDGGVLTIPAIKITTGAGAGKLYTSDADGNGTWETFETALADYGSSSTIVGWAAGYSKNIYYKKMGKMVYVDYNIQGTSNANTASFTVPYTAAARSDFVNAVTVDNGGELLHICRGYLASGETQVVMFKEGYWNAWTASGTKFVVGNFWYVTS